MGVDAGLFAKKSKKYYWFDREHNIRAYWHTDYSEKWKALEDCYYALSNSKDGVTAQAILPFLEQNRQCWLEGEESQRYRVNVIDTLIKFVNRHPDDLFFVITDHGSDWPEIMDEYKEENL